MIADITAYGIRIDFTPWFNNYFKFNNLHLYEELGGALAYGTMDLEFVSKKEALDLIEHENTGLLRIEKDGGNIYEIPICISEKTLNTNFFNIKFYCVKNKSFWANLITKSWIGKNLKTVIEDACSENMTTDIRINSDIQGTEISYYQSHESTMSFLSRICLGYKKQSTFGFGWEGLVIKDIMGDSDSYGFREPHLKLSEGGEFSQITPLQYLYDPSLYKQPISIWEDKNKIIATQDFSKVAPINLRVVEKYGQLKYVSKEALQLQMNSSYNRTYVSSDSLYSSLSVKCENIPRYKLGDVLEYERASIKFDQTTIWPFKYYLVKSNEFEISVPGMAPVQSERAFSWTTKLLGLDENGSIALGSENDPTEIKR